MMKQSSLFSLPDEEKQEIAIQSCVFFHQPTNGVARGKAFVYHLKQQKLLNLIESEKLEKYCSEKTVILQ